MNEVVDYIEDRINDKLSLKTLADEFGISDFHFNRIFKTVTGSTLKQYILGRKLTVATQLLSDNQRSIIDIAYELNFEYPEVFSRAFKKQFSITPSQYRANYCKLEGVAKAHIIERDIANYGGVLALKGCSTYIKQFFLSGIPINTNINNIDFKDKLEVESNNFAIKSLDYPDLRKDFYYTVVNCNGEDTGDYIVFCGRRTVGDIPSSDFQKREIPEGWYASFRYNGDMFDIQETFIDDLYRFIMVKEAKLNPNGIGMLDIYSQDYPSNASIEILVPILNPF